LIVNEVIFQNNKGKITLLKALKKWTFKIPKVISLCQNCITNDWTFDKVNFTYGVAKDLFVKLKHHLFHSWDYDLNRVEMKFYIGKALITKTRCYFFSWISYFVTFTDIHVSVWISDDPWQHPLDNPSLSFGDLGWDYAVNVIKTFCFKCDSDLTRNLTDLISLQI